MKAILNQLYNHETLNRETAKEVLINIANEKYNSSQVASFITVFLMRPIAVEELAGFKSALLELCVPVDFSDFNTIDLCGTGGDGKNTFNISTLTSFIVAGAGYKVTKHGNYGVSSGCGSSNVLEHFGYQFTNNEETLKKQLDAANICFLHAPLFHPAMKAVAPIRKELGIKTFFNMLGPIVNPARPQNQLVGVFNLELARVYNYLFQQSEANYCIVHALDGYDEISLTGNFKAITRSAERTFSPRDLNLSSYTPTAIYGGESVEDAATIFKDILEGNGTQAQNDVVKTNAAFAIQCVSGKDFSSCFEEAEKSLEYGHALSSFKHLLQ